MATDCGQLSRNARKIFRKFKAYYPPDPWKNPQWIEEGKVYDNGWHDLRTSIHRDKLIERRLLSLGNWVRLVASMYRKKQGTLKGFTSEHFTKGMQRDAEVLLLLEDLDFQIETLDIVEG